MTPAQLRRSISLLKVDGINQILYDAIQLYARRKINPDIAHRISAELMQRYKEQLPKKIVKVRQKLLDEEIEDAYRSGKMKITTEYGNKETTGSR